MRIKTDNNIQGKNHSVNHLVYGKISPQAKDIEQAILGAILLEKDAFDRAAAIVKPETFYVESHRLIFEALRKMASQGKQIDSLLLQEELRASGDLEIVGGGYYIDSLTSHVVSSTHIESHCRIVLQKYIQRELIRVCGEIIGEAYEDGADPFEMLDKAEEVFSSIGQSLDFGDMTPMANVLVQTIKKIEEWRQLDTHITGVPCGFAEIDKATRGWQNTDLIIIAARPSVGKTAFALNILKTAALHFKQQKKGQAVAMFSLEMQNIMLSLRMLSAASGEGLYNLQTGRMDESRMKNLYTSGIQELAKLDIYFDDRPGITMQRLRSKARKMKRRKNLGLIIIDYLQLIPPDQKEGTREQEVSKISRALKSLAMELEVPIIALSQMSRDFEKRTGEKTPQLSDLRESGSIEQDADVVMFIWAPSDTEIMQDRSMLTKRHIRIAKQRNGVTLTTQLDFKDSVQLFSDPGIGTPELNGGKWRPVDFKDYTEPSKPGVDMPF